jgi:hypothetical protein
MLGSAALNWWSVRVSHSHLRAAVGVYEERHFCQLPRLANTVTGPSAPWYILTWTQLRLGALSQLPLRAIVQPHNGSGFPFHNGKRYGQRRQGLVTHREKEDAKPCGTAFIP